MKKMKCFVGFIVLTLVLVCGAIMAFAEGETRFDADTMTLRHTDRSLQFSENGSMYLAAYKNGHLLGVSVKYMEPGNCVAEIVLKVSDEPDTVKIMAFGANLKPVAEVTELKKTELEQTEEADITIDGSSVESYDEEAGRLYYYANIDAQMPSTFQMDTEKLAVIYNGGMLSASDIEEMGGFHRILCELADSVTIDKEPGETLYTKLCITDYTNKRVTAVNVSQESVQFTYGVLDLNGDARNDDGFVYNLVDTDGNVLALSDVRENDIFSMAVPVYEGLTGDYASAPYLDIVVSRRTEKGMADSIVHSDGSWVCVLNGKGYPLEETVDVSVGVPGTFYISASGRICDFVWDADRNPAFITECRVNENPMESTYLLKLLTKDNSMTAYTMADRVKVHNGDGAAVTYRKQDGSLDEFFVTVQNLLEAETTSEKVMTKLGNRMVRFATDENGKIDELWFSEEFSETFERKHHRSVKYMKGPQMFGKYDLDAESSLFIAPVEEDGTGSYQVNLDKTEAVPFEVLSEDGVYEAYCYMMRDCDYLMAAVIGEAVIDRVTLFGGIESYDETTGEIVAYREKGDQETASLWVSANNLSVYYNGTRMTETEEKAFGGLKTLMMEYADEIMLTGSISQAYDTVWITDYVSRRVVEMDTEAKTVTFADGTILFLDSAMRNHEFVYTLNHALGTELALEDICKNDVLCMQMPLYNGTMGQLNDVPTMKIIVMNDFISGTVQEKISEDCYKINDVYYCFSGDTEPETGKTYIFYLDIKGDICDMEEVEESVRNYGFMTDFCVVESFGETKANLQLLTDSGTLEASFASRVRVYAEKDGIYDSATYETEALSAVLQPLFASQATENAATENIRKRYVSYRTNNNGEINGLYIAGNGTMFSAETVEKGAYNKVSGTFANRALGKNAVVFAAPVTYDGNAYSVNSKKVRIISFDELDENMKYSLTLYSFDGDGYVCGAVSAGAISKVKSDAHLAVVISSGDAKDAEGNATVQYTITEEGKTVTKIVNAEAFAEEMFAGDVFRYAENENGEIIETDLIYVAANNAFSDKWTYQKLNTNGFAVLYGDTIQVRVSNRLVTLDGTNGEQAFRWYSDEGTFVKIDASKLTGADPATAVKILKGAANLSESYGLYNYFSILRIDYMEEVVDCVQIQMKK